MKLLALTVAVLMSTYVWAEEESAPEAKNTGEINSEYLHQAQAGHWEVTPGTGIGVVSSEVRNSTVNEKHSFVSIPFLVIGEYGITSKFAVAASLKHVTTRLVRSCDSPATCKDNTFKGMADPQFEFKSQFNMGTGLLRAGAQASFGIEKGKLDSEGDGNQATGATTVTPYVAYEMPVGGGILGGKISYEAVKGDRKLDDSSTTPTTNYTVSGGAKLELDGYYEWRLRKVTFGGALKIETAPETTIKTASASAKQNDGYTAVGIETYVPIHVKENITLLPLASWASYSLSSNYQYKNRSVFIIAFGTRFEF